MPFFNPEERPIPELLETGFIIIDKPQGPTSHEVSAWVRKILGARKSGHPGTLDPQVSGVLPVAINRSTRILSELSGADKEYVGVIRFRDKQPPEKVEDLFKKFTGTIEQTPPKMSAVRRRKRKRKVYNLIPLEYKGKDVLFSVSCEAGTYIRTLCSDMGKLVTGAEMIELRRTKFGKISEGNCHTLQELSDALWKYEEKNEELALRSIAKPLEAFITSKRITAKDSALESICSGAPLNAPGVLSSEEFSKGEKVAIMNSAGGLVALGTAEVESDEIKNMEKGVVARPKSVIMLKEKLHAGNGTDE